MSEHAYLGCSKSHQWLNCTPSVRLESHFPDEQSPYAAEGRLAHELGERALVTGKSADEIIGDYSQEMRDAVQVYLDYVRWIKHEHMLVEVKLDVSPWVPEGFGTSDCVLIDRQTIHVIDYKHGKGVAVDVENNSQAMLYGLGAINEYDLVYGPFTDIVLHIVQPRIHNISSWTTNVDALLAWGETVKPIAEIAFKGEGEAVAGDHCRFCKARHSCRARADMMIATVSDQPAGELMADVELAALYPKLAGIVAWANDLQDQALKRAETGVKLPGLKLVEGRSVRTWADDGKVADRLLTNDFKPEHIYATKLLGIGAIETLVGKKKFTELLGDLITKPPGKPTLTTIEDKRSELSTNDAALAELLRS